MLRFVLAFAVPFVTTAAYFQWLNAPFAALDRTDWIRIALTLIVVPLATAAAISGFLHLRHPRRWLTSRAAGANIALLFGGAAGCAALVLTAVVAFYANQPLRQQFADPATDATWSASTEPNPAFLYPGGPTPYWWPGWSDQKRLPDALIIALCTFLCTLPAVWIMPLRRPGRCAKCNYDVRYSLHTDRCPECGTAVMQA